MPYKYQKCYNHLEKMMFKGVGEYDVPEIYPEEYKQVDWVAFDKAVSCKDRTNKGVHFYVDDYQFERIWNSFYKNIDLLSSYSAVMSPDWSIYPDWPDAVNIWNHYRKHYIAAYLQRVMEVTVYPSICWAWDDSFKWCFDGEPTNSCVSVSSVGSQMSARDKKGFMRGYDAMLERLNPSVILFYGNIPNECRGNIVRIGSAQDRFDKIGGV